MKRSKSSNNQSNKRPRRSSASDQSTFDPPTNESKSDELIVVSNQSNTSSFPNFLKIPLEVWNEYVYKHVGLKQVAVMRGVNRFFEPCWTRRFKLNLLPLRVPYDIATLDRAMRVIEILIDRKPGLPYSKEDPLVVELSEGEHRIASQWTDPDGVVSPNVLGITRSNITLLGKGKKETTIIGGFVICDQENINLKQMTVTNNSEWSSDGIKDGIHIRDANNVVLMDVKATGAFCALNLPTPIKKTTVVATNCDFADSNYGAVVEGALTVATFNDCIFSANQEDGIAGWESRIHLHGEATAVHSGECGIVADQNCKVFIHLPAGHDTLCYNNGWGDRVTSRGGAITNV